jgi:membrane-associated phospholipid phosphatase
MKRQFLAVVVFAVLALPLANVHGDEVTDWNQTLFRVAIVGTTSPLVISRSAAIVQTAVFDAVNGIEPRYTYLHVPPDAPSGASRRAAAVEAAFQTLTALYVTPPAPSPPGPAIGAILAARRAISMVEIARDPHESTASISAGVAWGALVAKQILEWRDGDGFKLSPAVDPGGPPGKWTYSAPPIGPQFATMTTWVLLTPDQFRPTGPPALTSAQYAADFNETKSMGAKGSLLRTADQTVAAWFWGGAGTASALWNGVALSLIERRDEDADRDGGEKGGHHHDHLLQNARLFAVLHLAVADAAIACWEAKYRFLFWRPFQAIPRAAEDGNAATAPSAFVTLLPTPNHPEYPSGHSTASGAAAGVLARYFGERTRFTVENDAVLGTTRSFRSFTSALDDVKDARIFAGIHFRTACNDGQAIGKNVANYVLAHALQPLDGDDD